MAKEKFYKDKRCVVCVCMCAYVCVWVVGERGKEMWGKKDSCSSFFSVHNIFCLLKLANVHNVCKVHYKLRTCESKINDFYSGD